MKPSCLRVAERTAAELALVVPMTERVWKEEEAEDIRFRITKTRLPAQHLQATLLPIPTGYCPLVATMWKKSVKGEEREAKERKM